MHLRFSLFLIQIWYLLRRARQRLGRFLRQNIGLILSYALFWLTPLICFLMVELLSMNSPFKLAAWQWCLNLVWYFFLLFVTWLITGRRRGSILLTVLLSFFAGLANHYVLSFRGRALFPIDLLSIKTALNVFLGYDYTPDRFVWGGVAIVAAVAVAVGFLPRQRTRARAKWLTALKLGLSGLWAVYIFLFFFTGLLPQLNIYAQQWKTQGNGFLLNFTVSAAYMRPSRPDGYSNSRAEALIDTLEAEGLTSDAADGGADTATNFIVIMDESFADYTWFENLTLSEDPTPFLHALMETTIKGKLVSPVTGGGTAGVEFECLTGNTMAFFPYGTVAYQLYMTEQTPSLAWTADALGGETAAYHPYESSGWNRPTAYRLLGFESQYYLDQVIGGTAFGTDYADDEIVRQFVSDAADFERLYRITDAANAAGKSSFIFNVTMQNHSGYAMSWTNLPRSATLTGEFDDPDYGATTNQFLALAAATDRALEELIGHYANVDEPTVILFFGDHQPPLKNSFYEALYGKALDDRTAEEVLEQYVTPFFLWANFDIEAQEDVVIGANFLGVLASRIAGYPQTGYQKFLARLNETFAAITPVHYVLQDGTVIDADASGALTPEQRSLVEQYQSLQFYNLFGPDGRDGFFFWDGRGPH